MDKEAYNLWSDVYHDLSESLPGLLGAITGRAEAQTVRTALIYAVLDSSEQIKAVHLRAALALWRYCSDSVRYIFGDSVGDPFADELLRALRDGGGMGRTDIYRHFRNNPKRDQIDATFAALERMGKIRRDDRATGSRGPKAEFWVAVK
jgi:hypothetical protein